MWNALRGRRMAGLRFRRQQPVGPYVADFYCSQAKLIVEMDGSQHVLPENRAHDEQRTAWLKAQGFRIIRIWNSDFLREPENTLDFIAREIERLGIPYPEIRVPRISTLPQGEGGKTAEYRLILAGNAGRAKSV